MIISIKKLTISPGDTQYIGKGLKKKRSETSHELYQNFVKAMKFNEQKDEMKNHS